METACRIDQSRFELSVGLFLKTSEHTNLYRDTLQKRGVKFIPLIAESQFSPSVINTIISAVKEHKIDIIHAHDYKSDILTTIVSKKIKIPIVTTAHGWITNSLKSKIYVWLGKHCFRFFDQVIAVSPKIYSEIARFGTSEKRLNLIYNAIVADNYQPDKFEAGYLREKFNIPESVSIIGNIGRISPEKGQKDFILAAKKILNERQDLAFVLIGDGPDKKAMQQLAVDLEIEKHVHFTGHEQDVRPVLKDLNLFALTSYTEGFPNVVLESLCMDVPVLATDVGGTGDIVDNKKTGILIPSGSPDEIAKGLNYLLDNPDKAKEMTKSGKLKIMECYEFSARVKKIERLYEKIIIKK
ncbi:MAG: glycosyltransferase [Gammaproteobacteria bacterium]|nr:glycosyltransferase [Gammaproteobacteria bacterium]